MRSPHKPGEPMTSVENEIRRDIYRDVSGHQRPRDIWKGLGVVRDFTTLTYRYLGLGQ